MLAKIEHLAFKNQAGRSKPRSIPKLQDLFAVSLGLGLAAGYLAADYYFDFKSHIQESIKYYRREEEK